MLILLRGVCLIVINIMIIIEFVVVSLMSYGGLLIIILLIRNLILDVLIFVFADIILVKVFPFSRVKTYY